MNKNIDKFIWRKGDLVILDDEKDVIKMSEAERAFFLKSKQLKNGL